MFAPGPPGPERFRPDARLRRRSDYKRVYAVGRRLSGRLVVVFAVPKAGSGDRLGVTATRKVGGAVVRNRAKRRVREVFRRWTAGRPDGPVMDVVVNVSERAAKAPAAAVREELLGLLARAAGGRT